MTISDCANLTPSHHAQGAKQGAAGMKTCGLINIICSPVVAPNHCFLSLAPSGRLPFEAAAQISLISGACLWAVRPHWHLRAAALRHLLFHSG